jgi:hypothetical protein
LAASIGVLIFGGAVVALTYDGSDTASQVTTSAVTTVTPIAGTTVSTGGSSVPVTTDAVGEPEEIVLQAETGAIQSPMTSEFDNSALGGRFVQTNAGAGAVDFTFKVKGGEYVVWARVAAGLDVPLEQDSFVVAVDGGAPDTWDLFETTDIPPTDWSWEQVSLRCGGDNNVHNCNPQIFTLGPGEHTLSILGRESGSKLDAIVITDDVVGRPALADT